MPIARRQFIVSSLALIGANRLNAEMSMASEPAQASAPALEASRLIDAQPLKNLTPIAFTNGKAMLDIAPSQTVLFKDGTATKTWAYSSGQGNMIDVFEGDRLLIESHNQLPEATTIHWHGINVPADQDGSGHHPFQAGTTNINEFIVPNDSAGTYWFHPHPHGRTAFQTAQGLAAPFIIRSKSDLITALGIKEFTLFFTAPSLDENAQIEPQSMSEQMNGRGGNLVLINGQFQPTLALQNGETYRLRLCNASNGRYLRLSFDDADMVQIGTDGGLLSAPLAPIADLILAPAERAEVLVRFHKTTNLKARSYERGFMGGMGMSEVAAESIDVQLMGILISGEPIPKIAIPNQLRQIEPLGDAVITRQFELTENMQMSVEGGKHSMRMEFMINGKTFDMNRVDFTSKLGDVELWEVTNQTDMDHPFHIHGHPFQVQSIEENGALAPFPYLAWKDTVNIKKKQTLRLKIKQNMLGLRMYHCHILEHEDLGMMGQYEVVEG